MVQKKMMLLFLSAAATTLCILLSIKQKMDQLTEEDSNNLPVGVYPVKKNDEKLKRKRLKPHLCKISQLPLYTFSRNKGAHDNGGGCGWSEPDMRKNYEL